MNEPTKEVSLSWRDNPLLLAARFPRELDSPQALAQFARVCMAVNLNPFLSEIVPIHGRPYVTEEGWLRLIDERAPGELIRDDVNLASKEEKEFFVGANVKGWMGKATATRRMFRPNWAPSDAPPFADREVTEWYFLSVAAVENSVISAVHEEPFRQAMKGAHVRALRKAFRDVLAAVGDLAIEEDFSPEAAQQIAGLIATRAESTSDDDERRRFWARATKLGIRNGSQELADLFRLPEVGPGAMKKHWLDTGHTWMEANTVLDELEATGGSKIRVSTAPVKEAGETCSELTCLKEITTEDKDCCYGPGGEFYCSAACASKTYDEHGNRKGATNAQKQRSTHAPQRRGS